MYPQKLIGKTFNEIIISSDKKEVTFFTDGSYYKMYHQKDWGEDVWLEDVDGDINDLIGSPIINAEKVTNKNQNGINVQLWTFYKFQTAKGYVTLRWCGESNGYYSMSVFLREQDVPYDADKNMDESDTENESLYYDIYCLVKNSREIYSEEYSPDLQDVIFIGTYDECEGYMHKYYMGEFDESELPPVPQNDYEFWVYINAKLM